MGERFRAKLSAHPDYALSMIDDRLYGSFVEHMARCVYTGIYEPGHPSADEMGFRTDVLALARGLNLPIVRYPGGNFVSGYRWEDGIGPKELRPRRAELAWQAIETNQIGTDEFMAWCARAGAKPMLAVNLGTRGLEAAANLVEYTNFPKGTRYSDLRAANGHPEPYGVKYWCLGNEMDGPWQIARKTAEEYARIAEETAKAMKWVDPTIELVACGSSAYGMDTMGRWEATVLERCYEHVEYISAHAYYGKEGDDAASYLSVGEEASRYIEAVVAACDYARAIKRGTKRIMVSFDEWNVTNRQRVPETEKWAEVRSIGEAVYTREDAVAAGGVLISFLKHADRVKIACQAQLVNLLGLIMTEPGDAAWRQTIYHPFALTSRYGRGESIRTAIVSPKLVTKRLGEVDAIDAACVKSAGELTLFLINRDPGNEALVEADLRGFGPKRAIGCVSLSGEPDDVNDAAREAVAPVETGAAKVDSGTLTLAMPPASWAMVRIETAEGSARAD